MYYYMYEGAEGEYLTLVSNKVVWQCQTKLFNTYVSYKVVYMTHNCLTKLLDTVKHLFSTLFDSVKDLCMTLSVEWLCLKLLYDTCVKQRYMTHIISLIFMTSDFLSLSANHLLTFTKKIMTITVSLVGNNICIHIIF